MFGRVLIMLISSNIWCVAPSSPTVIPACVAHIFTLAFVCAIVFLIWSYALPAANTAKVLTYGIFPKVLNPAPVPIISCSAIPISKNLSGNSFAKIDVFVAPDKSASSTTTFLFSSPSSAKASP